MDLSALQQDYDHFSGATVEAMRGEWARRRDECPVSYSDTHGGFVFLTKYDDVAAALADTTTYSSTNGAAIPPQPFQFLPEDLDPPESRKYRHLINPPLAPQRVATYEGWVRDIAVELLDGIGDREEFDVIDVFARPLPQRVTMRLVGLPAEGLDLVARTTTTLTVEPRGSDRSDAAGAALFGYLGEVIEQRKRQAPREDFISDLLAAQIDGQALTGTQLLSFVALLLFGGLHTTTGAVAGALVWLADHPDAVSALSRPGGIDARVINEIIRFTGPSSHLGRTATRDVTVRGCPVQEGQTVMLGIASANHDPDKFDRPDTMVLDRSPNNHLGFGLGPHRCVGSHLAKLQLRVALEEFLARYPRFEIPDRSRLELAGGEVRALTTLPIRLTGGAG